MQVSERSFSSRQSLFIAVGGTALAAILSRRLAKSAIQPLIYACSAIGAWRLLKAAPSAPRSKALKLWTAQIGLSALWSNMFLGKKWGQPSVLDGTAQLFDSAALTYYTAKVDKPAAALFAPTVGWLVWGTAGAFRPAPY